MTNDADWDGYSTIDILVELIGEEKTEKLCLLYGGRYVYIPAKFSHDHCLAQAIGFESTVALSRHFCTGKSGNNVLIPKGNIQKTKILLPVIAQMSDKGQSANTIANSLKIHVRTVYRVRSRNITTRLKRYHKPLQALLQAGKSYREIAAALCLSDWSVGAMVRALKRKNRQK